MIDFILAGLIYVAIMFSIFFILSFLTIGVAYTLAAGMKRFVHFISPQDLALK